MRVIEFNGGALRELASFYAYDPAFVGGVSVAGGDVTGDGIAEVITGAGAGGGPHVRVIDLSGGNPTEIASFYAYDPAFTGGVRVASNVGGPDVFGHVRLERTFSLRAIGPVDQGLAAPDVWRFLRHFPSSELAVAMMAPRCGERR